MDNIELPEQRTCGQMQVHQRLLESVPTFRASLGRLEAATHRRLMSAASSKLTGPITISIVVHVVYNAIEQNITDAQVMSQITVLNDDFSCANLDRVSVPPVWAGLPTDSKIRFELARRDPAGAPSNGITRTQTGKPLFTDNDDVKRSADGGIDPWPTDRYLNIWVCPLGRRLLGYAQFPAGPEDTDGVAILYKAFGTEGTAQAPFDRGRTIVHEVGHYLNLRHIWGDTEDCSGSDLVADTPQQHLPNYGVPRYPHISCSNGPEGDMFMNYMDYVDDQAMVMFTPGQIQRMHATLAGPRRLLVS